MAETADITAPALAAVSKLPGACFMRVNSGTFRTLDGRRIVRAVSVNGSADIQGCYLTKSVQIETKTPIGRLSDDQKNFRKRWLASGGIYIIALTPESAVAQLKDLFR